MMVMLLVMMVSGTEDKPHRTPQEVHQEWLHQPFKNDNKQDTEEHWLATVTRRGHENDNTVLPDQEETNLPGIPRTYPQDEENTMRDLNDDQDTTRKDQKISEVRQGKSNEQLEAQREKARAVTLAVVKAAKATGRLFFGDLLNGDTEITFNLQNLTSSVVIVVLFLLFLKLVVPYLSSNNFSKWFKGFSTP